MADVDLGAEGLLMNECSFFGKILKMRFKLLFLSANLVFSKPILIDKKHEFDAAPSSSATPFLLQVQDDSPFELLEGDEKQTTKHSDHRHHHHKHEKNDKHDKHDDDEEEEEQDEVKGKDYAPLTVKDRLVKLSEDGPAIAMSEKDIFNLYKKNQKFIDVTDGDYDLIESLSLSSDQSTTTTFPTEMAHKELVDGLIATIDKERMKKWLTSFTKFHTRYYKSKTGKESANWLFGQLEELAKSTVDGVKLSVEKFDHSWGQPSIIAKLHATTLLPESEAEIVILSAHQDSVNQWNPWFGRSPGADDNGSGSTTVWEALSILVAAGYVPEKRTLEFHWYSAEEGGLLGIVLLCLYLFCSLSSLKSLTHFPNDKKQKGSQKVVASYLQKKKPVFAVLHSDMTGYQPDGLEPIVGISSDFVSNPLSDTLIKITEAYSDVEWKYTKW